MNYKLIKLYPGLNININIGDIAHKCVSSNCYYIRDKEFAGMNLDKFPEFWEEGKLPLFTTENGVVVYENDTAWYVDLSENPIEVVKTVVKTYHKYTNRTDGVYLHLFSTEELANKFAEENKPQYSKKDMLHFVHEGRHYHASVPTTTVIEEIIRLKK